jgi:hypothetical protein
MKSLFIFNINEIMNCFNIVNSSLNSIIIFVWVNKKLTNSSKHNFVVKFSFIFLVIEYSIYIILTYFSSDNFIDIGLKFYLFPNFNKEIYFQNGSFVSYSKLIIIALNILNKIFLMNFYFMVIRSIIIKNDHQKYFEGNW